MPDDGNRTNTEHQALEDRAAEIRGLARPIAIWEMDDVWKWVDAQADTIDGLAKRCAELHDNNAAAVAEAGELREALDAIAYGDRPQDPADAYQYLRDRAREVLR